MSLSSRRLASFGSFASLRVASGVFCGAVFVLALLSCVSRDGRTGGSGPQGGTQNPDANPGQTGGCSGLSCYQMDCGAMPPTTVSGRVTAPNGIDPVYDALVYVPNTIAEFSATVQCETCNEPLGGDPLVQTRTAVDGTFSLPNIPVTASMPLVIQKGRFRRTVMLDPQACVETRLADDRVRLPKNRNEGDLPKIAVGVGDYDQIECVLHSMGIDQSEFTTPQQAGAVHLYDNAGTLSANGTDFAALLNNPTKMQTYNLIFINCTGNIFSMVPNRAAVLKNMYEYVNSGGRLYVTDLSYDYLEQVPQFSPYILYEGGGDQINPQPEQGAALGDDTSDISAMVVDKTLSDWLTAAHAAQSGRVTITDLLGGFALMNSASINQMKYASTTWVHGPTNGKDRPLTISFDYNSCGKVLYSSYHTREPGGGGGGFGFGGGPFPSYCKSTAKTMIAQEKILEFLILQISSCVGPIG